MAGPSSLRDVKNIDDFFETFGRGDSSLTGEDDAEPVTAAIRPPESSPTSPHFGASPADVFLPAPIPATSLEDLPPSTSRSQKGVRWQDNDEGASDQGYSSFKPLESEPPSELVPRTYEAATPSMKDLLKPSHPLSASPTLLPNEVHAHRGPVKREKGKWRKKWSPEWVVMEHGVLITCTKEEPFLVKLCVPLKNIQAIAQSSKRREEDIVEIQYIAAAKKGKECFAVMRLRCPTPAEASEWVDKLKSARQAAHQTGGRMVTEVVARDRAEAALKQLQAAMKNSGLFQLCSKLTGALKQADIEHLQWAWWQLRQNQFRKRLLSDHDHYRRDLQQAAVEVEQARAAGAVGRERAKRLLRAGTFLMRVGTCIDQHRLLALLQWHRITQALVIERQADGMQIVLTAAMVANHQMTARRFLEFRATRMLFALATPYHRIAGFAFLCLQVWSRYAASLRPRQRQALRAIIDAQEMRKRQIQQLVISALRWNAIRQRELERNLSLFFRQRNRDAAALALKQWLVATHIRNQQDIRAIRLLESIFMKRWRVNMAIGFARLMQKATHDLALDAVQVAVNLDWANQEICAGQRTVPQERACYSLAASVANVFADMKVQALHALCGHNRHRIVLERHTAVAARLLGRLERRRKERAVQLLVTHAMRRSKAVNKKSTACVRLATACRMVIHRHVGRTFDRLALNNLRPLAAHHSNLITPRRTDPLPTSPFSRLPLSPRLEESALDAHARVQQRLAQQHANLEAQQRRIEEQEAELQRQRQELQQQEQRMAEQQGQRSLRQQPNIWHNDQSRDSESDGRGEAARLMVERAKPEFHDQEKPAPRKKSFFSVLTRPLRPSSNQKSHEVESPALEPSEKLPDSFVRQSSFRPTVFSPSPSPNTAHSDVSLLQPQYLLPGSSTSIWPAESGIPPMFDAFSEERRSPSWPPVDSASPETGPANPPPPSLDDDNEPVVIQEPWNTVDGSPCRRLSLVDDEIALPPGAITRDSNSRRHAIETLQRTLKPMNKLPPGLSLTPSPLAAVDISPTFRPDSVTHKTEKLPPVLPHTNLENPVNLRPIVGPSIPSSGDVTPYDYHDPSSPPTAPSPPAGPDPEATAPEPPRRSIFGGCLPQLEDPSVNVQRSRQNRRPTPRRRRQMLATRLMANARPALRLETPVKKREIEKTEKSKVPQINGKSAEFEGICYNLDEPLPPFDLDSVRTSGGLTNVSSQLSFPPMPSYRPDRLSTFESTEERGDFAPFTQLFVAYEDFVSCSEFLPALLPRKLYESSCGGGKDEDSDPRGYLDLLLTGLPK